MIDTPHRPESPQHFVGGGDIDSTAFNYQPLSAPPSRKAGLLQFTLQASCRTLIVDSLPSSQQETAAAWASRLMGLGGIFGYFMGNVNIPELIPAFGDTQVKGLCIIACLFLILAVGTTCVTVTEQFLVRPPKTSNSFVGEFLQGFKSIFRSIRYLPTRIQQLCNVQFFAWMGWFPFLFYSSTYIAEIYTREQNLKGYPIDTTAPGESVVVQDAAVRAGNRAIFSFITKYQWERNAERQKDI
ncbi:hypothetical protein BGZ52_010263 [Haplosporangium bisporale]|nr:hypothetical protein BGZ52_010263 [Haplosporangium bisporale]